MQLEITYSATIATRIAAFAQLRVLGGGVSVWASAAGGVQAVATKLATVTAGTVTAATTAR